jgi:hypothetical protein
VTDCRISPVALSDEIAQIANPIFERLDLVASTIPSSPCYSDFSLLPDSKSSHSLYARLNTAIPRLLVMSGMVKDFDKKLLKELFALIFIVDPDTSKAVLGRARATGLKLTERQVRLTAESFLSSLKSAKQRTPKLACLRHWVDKKIDPVSPFEFSTYLKSCRSRVSLLRNFIDDARDDENFPVRVTSFDELHGYLLSQNACSEAIEAGAKLWKLYIFSRARKPKTTLPGDLFAQIRRAP